MEDLIQQLNETPEQWDLRCSIAQQYYESEQFADAAEVILAAPEIPAEEESVIFASTIIGTNDPASGHELVDQFLEANPESAAGHNLKAQLFEMQGDAESAAAHLQYAEQLNGAASPDAEPVEAPDTSDAVVARRMAPPGEEREAVLPSETAAEVPSITKAQPLAALAAEAEAETLEEAYTLEASEGPCFIVGEGEAIKGVDKESSAREKMGAITAAVIVHVVLIFALAAWTLATPRPTPPQISVSSLANTDESVLENQTMSKVQQKTAAAVASAQPVISSTAFSSFAMPEIVDMNSNLNMVSMSDSDAAFGMSMSGFGDVSNMSAIPAGMRSRCSMSQRMKRLRESGGEDRAEKAVRKGLEYLMTKQDPKTGAIGSDYTAGVTGLALLAYLGHCETPESPKFGDTVVNAALYLMERAKKQKGVITNGKGGHHTAYEHAIGTYALAELYTMTKESGKEIPQLDSVLRKAAGHITDAQTKIGGWSYFKGDAVGNPDGKDDGSVAMWMFQALKAMHNTGLKITSVEKAMDKAVEDYIPANQDSEGAFKYNLDNAKGKNSLTGAHLLALQLWGQKGSAVYNSGLNYLNKAYANPVPSAGGHGLYDEYYNTQVYFMHEGDEWKNYNSKFQGRLLDMQQPDGSWTIGGGKGEDGHTMNTAWAILMLEVYYRYLPTTDKVKDLEAR